MMVGSNCVFNLMLAMAVWMANECYDHQYQVMMVCLLIKIVMLMLGAQNTLKVGHHRNAP